MAGINVLSDTLKVGSKLEKTATPKGKDVSDSSGNAAVAFAAMLSGSMNQNVDPKGQNSKAGQDLDEKQSTGDSVQSDQNPNGLGSMLGYGNFALPFLTQMLQSDLPAGKEANSGNVESQGTVGLATANTSLTSVPVVSGNNLELALLNLISLGSDEGSAQSGMTTPKPQGDNPAITELDKYRQVIADLLVALSGEIADNSLKGKPSSLESTGTNNLSQDMAKIVQGWMAATDEVSKGGQATSGQATESGEIPKALQEGGATIANLANSSFNKAFDSLEALSGDSAAPYLKGNPLNSENTGVNDLRQDLTKIIQGWMTLTDDVTKNGSVSATQKGIQPLLDVLSAGFGSANPVLNAKVATLLAALNPILSQEVKDAKTPQGVNGTLDAEGGIIDPAAKGSSELHVQQKSDVMGPQENKTSKFFQGTFREEVQKGDSMQSTELSGGKDVQNQNSSLGIGLANNIVTANVTDGKTIAVPVWEQISTVIREQVMNRSQDLKQLDIQLHPADLGKIQIDLRWEDGQVHLQVQASQAATGQLLQNQLPDLRQALINHGVNCGMLQMGQGGERQQNPHGDQSGRTFNQNTHLNEDEDPILVNNPLSLEQDGINRINVMA